ncbi:hypothetical protein GJ496_000828 [Pomphorhynchus laevis]|nr:hypothetical protein GJ496_000828 [Pomphorhynchus laevis]
MFNSVKCLAVNSRFSNHLKLKRIPGNILTGKHRIYPRLSFGHKRHLMLAMEMEVNNMKYLSNPYLKDEEEQYAIENNNLADNNYIEKTKKSHVYLDKTIQRLCKFKTWE